MTDIKAPRSAETTASPVEALARSGPGVEVWLDSSPLIYRSWAVSALAAAVPERKPLLAGWLEGMLSPERPLESAITGATTNPPLSFQAIQASRAEWDCWVDERIRERPDITLSGLFWTTYLEVIRRGSALLLPIFEASNYRRGYLSAQVDPRTHHDLDNMIEQAVRINGVSPNVMVKMPGTALGIEGIRRLTARGVPTTATLTCIVPQLIAAAEAVKAGLVEARANGVDLSKWRSAVTMMLGRFEDSPVMRQEATELGIDLTEDDIRWSGVAVFKQAYRLYKERGYESRLLGASMRAPVIDGRVRVRHLEELAGANAVLTVFPNVYAAFLDSYSASEITSRIDAPVPQDVLERLLRVPFFARAYDEHGYGPDEFESHPVVVDTAAGFVKSSRQLEDYCASRLVAVGKQPNGA